MRKLALLALVAAGAIAVPGATAQPIKHYLSVQKVTVGFFRDSRVEYLDLGPVKLAAGNKVAPIWTFANGTKAQRNVIDTVPGRADYTPLWQVNVVTFKSGVTQQTLRSAAEIKAAATRGDVTVKTTATVVNCPVI